jgi:hypothetical protein
MTPTSDHYADIANGRRIWRIAAVILYVSGAWMVLFLAVGLVAVWAGWMADDDPTLAVVGVAIAGCGLLVSFAFGFRARRLVQWSIAAVAAGPGFNVPDHLQVGTTRPGLWAAVRAGVAIAALAAIPLVGRHENSYAWVWPELCCAFGLVAYAWYGPSAERLESAYLDRSGIRLTQLGLHFPWASVRQIRVAASEIVITIGGPISATGEQPRVWTSRALARHRPGSSLHAAMPEKPHGSRASLCRERCAGWSWFRPSGG